MQKRNLTHLVMELLINFRLLLNLVTSTEMHFLQANSLLTQTAAQGLRCFLGGQIPRICHPVSALNLEVRILPISLLNCFWVYTNPFKCPIVLKNKLKRLKK